MRITPSQTFLHGRERYEEGETYDVDVVLGAYFVGNGWAADETGHSGPPAVAEVTLDIEPAAHGHEGSTVEVG